MCIKLVKLLHRIFGTTLSIVHAWYCVDTHIHTHLPIVCLSIGTLPTIALLGPRISDGNLVESTCFSSIQAQPSDVQYDCNGEGTRRWYFNGDLVLTNGAPRTFAQITVTAAGNYTCTLENGCGISRISDFIPSGE